MKTMKQWNGSGLDLTQFLQTGDIVDDELYWYFVEVLPPATMSNKCIQLGEPSCHNSKGQPMFETLERNRTGDWVYTGRNTRPSIN